MADQQQPEKILHVSTSQLSMAKYYGSVALNGARYIYNPVEDSLTRQDVLRKAKEYRVFAWDVDTDKVEYVGETYKQMRPAWTWVRQDRSGRVLFIFGPEGFDVQLAYKDGELYDPERHRRDQLEKLERAATLLEETEGASDATR